MFLDQLGGEAWPSHIVAVSDCIDPSDFDWVPCRCVVPTDEGWNGFDGVSGEGGWGCCANVRVVCIVGVVDVGCETRLASK